MTNIFAPRAADFQAATHRIHRSSGPTRNYLDPNDRTMPAWYLARGERPVHYGENFVDDPDNVPGIFAAHALLAGPDRRSAVAADVDIPWCAGDLFSIDEVGAGARPAVSRDEEKGRGLSRSWNVGRSGLVFGFKALSKPRRASSGPDPCERERRGRNRMRP